MTTNPINLTPDNFETEVLKSDPPTVVVVIVLPADDYYDDEGNIDYDLEPYRITTAGFKSELQNIAGDKYKIGLIPVEYAQQLNLDTFVLPIVPIGPPPIPFLVFINGDVIDKGPLSVLTLYDDFYYPLKEALTKVPTTFPNGDFRIINVDTGDALYVKLGNITTISYVREGNETNYYVSDDPTIGVRQPSGGAEEAFYFDTSEDRGERQPRFQLVSVGVDRVNRTNQCISRNLFDTQVGVRIYGCGTVRGSENDWRWQTEGGYIWAADDEYHKQNKSYLTITNGSLTLDYKGKAGQRWRFEDPK
jgi:hypothetical protein